MTDAELQAIRERAEKATPGSWVWINGEFFGALEKVNSPLKSNNADRRFISHARQDIPALLAEIDRLRARDALLAGALDKVAFLESCCSLPTCIDTGTHPRNYCPVCLARKALEDLDAGCKWLMEMEEKNREAERSPDDSPRCNFALGRRPLA